MECREVERFIDAYVDFEFAEPERLEIETHLSSCEGCRQMVHERALVKASLRATVRRPAAPLSLRTRIDAALDKQDQASRTLDAVGFSQLTAARTGGQPAWRRAMPLLLMAVPLLLILTMHRRPESPLITDSIIRHQRNLPPEISGDSRVVLSWFDGKVPFAVRAPRLEPLALLRGGRLSSVGNREAAYLQYDVQGNKVSVFIFDPDNLQMSTTRRQIIGSQEVYLQGARGYNVALFRRQGLGYAIAGSLDEPDLIRLIAAAVSGR